MKISEELDKLKELDPDKVYVYEVDTESPKQLKYIKDSFQKALSGLKKENKPIIIFTEKNKLREIGKK